MIPKLANPDKNSDPVDSPRKVPRRIPPTIYPIKLGSLNLFAIYPPTKGKIKKSKVKGYGLRKTKETAKKDYQAKKKG